MNPDNTPVARLLRWLVLAWACLASYGALAQVSQDWMVSTPNTYGKMIALDKSDNAYVAGAVPWSAMTLTKYSPSGATLWKRSFGNPGTGVRPTWVTVDSAGNAIVTGSIVRVDGLNPFGRIVLKYDAAGTLLWQEVITRQGIGTARVVTDAANNVYAVGESPQTVVRYRQTNAANQLPSAVAAANKTTGTSPLGVTFSSAGSSDPDGRIVAYEWSFGDGTTSIQPNPYHVYGPGTYTATLKVIDDRFDSAVSAPITIRVQAAVPLATSVTVSPSTVVGGRSVQATVTLSSYNGAVVTLRSSHPAVASVPASVVVPVGSNAATFTVQTTAVASRTTASISARTIGLQSRSATLTVLPPGGITGPNATRDSR